MKKEKKVNLKPKGFTEEKDLRRLLLENLNIIPVEDISDGEDENIITLRDEFPITEGSIDVLALGDGGGIYILETKLYKNPDKRKVIAQVLDYATALWKEYAQNSEKFLEKLQEKEESGQISEEEYEELLENVERNLSEARYNILIVIDSVTPQMKDLIEFLNKHTSFKVLALQVKRYVDDKLEIIVPEVYGTEISKEISPSSAPYWHPEELRAVFQKVTNHVLRDRLFRVLEWSLEKNLFAVSKGKEPLFAITGSPNKGRIFGFRMGGGIFCVFGYNESDKYPSVEDRYQLVKELKALGLLPPEVDPDKTPSGKYLAKRLGELTDEEFNRLLKAMERHLVSQQ
ncbi:MAG: hypothetical protein QXO01_05720 [Nitrososphaerota archaeon]